MNDPIAQFANRPIQPQRLEDFATKVLSACGLRPSHARETAVVLTAVDTWGVFTHGTRQLVPLISNLESGAIRRNTEPEVIFAEGGTILVDGKDAMPMVTSRLAMNAAIDRARETGIAYAGVRHSNHFGAAGYYAMMAAQSDMIGISMSNVDPCMMIPGSAGKVIGPNPIAFAAPAGGNKPVFLDIATSIVAVSKIFSAKASGTRIPDNWIADRTGRPTTDPNDYPDRATILPMAGHKGYGIALFIEILSGVLTGSSFLSGVKRWVDPNPERADQGHAFIAINIDPIMPLPIFRERMDAMIDEIRSAPKATTESRILVPGEMEWQRHTHAHKHGMQLPDYVLTNLFSAARKTGLVDALESAFDAPSG